MRTSDRRQGDAISATAGAVEPAVLDAESEQERERLAVLQGCLGHTFSDHQLLRVALTHRSYSNEAARDRELSHNERLEFLGDAVLGLCVTHLLMTNCPQASEGYLSLLRSQLVSEPSLCERAKEIGLGDALRLGRGEEGSGGRQKPSLLANAYEAVLGALYLDSGFDVCLVVTERLLLPSLLQAHRQGGSDQKSALQDLLQRLRRARPRYEVVATSGPDHDKLFEVAVYLDDRHIASGSGRSKRAAEQAAAEQALTVLNSELL